MTKFSKWGGKLELSGYVRMFEMKYPNLFKPIVLGNTLFKNRIFAAPTGYMALDAENFPPQEAAEYYEMKARGGAAVVTVGETTVDSVHGKGTSKDLALDKEACIPSIAMIADGISKHGAIASIELTHPGMFSHTSHAEGNEIYGPVEMEIRGSRAGESLKGVYAKEMPEAYILEVIEKFADAARRAKQAGFGMVLVHGGHGWLLSQFMSPKINTRKDKWGGSSIENRMRLPIAICDRIKEKCGKSFPIEFRMSGDEVNPNGYTIADGIEMAKAIDGHADLIHVSTGNHEVYESFVITHPSMFLEDGCNLKYASEIKKHVKTPVAAVGAFNDPAQMEEIIASGQVDVLEMARGLIADPDMPVKARMGKPKDIKQCLRCFTCFTSVIEKGQFTCAINPVIGRETENKVGLVPTGKKTVLVAGGGVAGMHAALTAADLGHRVILCEKTHKLGGTLLCESTVTFKKKLDIYLEGQARRVHHNALIDVRLNTAATAELAESISPDAIIAAMGARPIIPAFIKGIDGKNVAGAEEIYYNINRAGKKVVVLGGGLVGSELAIHLALNGRDVTILEMMPELNAGGNILHGQAINVKISELNITLALGTKALEITKDGIIGDGPGGQKLFEADTVIYAIGQSPLRAEADALRFCAPEFYQIGDCTVPANITQAVKMAHYAARNIGRI